MALIAVYVPSQVYGASATAMALLARDRGLSAGQVIDLSLLEPIVSVLGPEAAIHKVTGTVKQRVGSASNTSSSRNVYRCADGRYVALSGSTQPVAKRILEIIGRADMIADLRFATNSDRVMHRPLVDEAVSVWFSTRTRDEALAIMREAGATVGPVYDVADASQDPHFQQRAVVADVEDAEFGDLPMHNIVPRLSATPGVWRYPAPRLGEHTRSVLREAGVSDAIIEAAAGGAA